MLQLQFQNVLSKKFTEHLILIKLTTFLQSTKHTKSIAGEIIYRTRSIWCKLQSNNKNDNQTEGK
jgi:hypothetical protein